MKDDVAVKRDIIRVIADIKLLERVNEATSFGTERVKWRWKFGAQPGSTDD